MFEEYEPPGAPALTPRQEEVRREFHRRRGYWAKDWDILNRLDVDFMDAYTNLSAYAKEHGSGTLDEITREFVYIATCASVTHSFVIGIVNHTRQALRAGATPAQLMAVFEVLTGMGIVSWNLAVEALEDVRPGSTVRRPVDEARMAGIRELYAEIFGGWDDEAEAWVRADPEFYEVYLQLIEVPRLRSTAITPRQAALVSLAANACVTHMDRQALRRDVAAALHHGATVDEVLEVCAIITGIGVHALSLGIPALVDVLAEEGRTPFDS